MKEKFFFLNKDNVWDLWNNLKCWNVLVIGIPEGEEREKGTKSIFEELMVENFSNEGKETDI